MFDGKGIFVSKRAFLCQPFFVLNEGYNQSFKTTVGPESVSATSIINAISQRLTLTV